ncbi:DUF2141 domain-containing protein [Novosphingobium album (ex Liu et al. 2023)]|uniref:DUF2141 domain-containing protein n=1 Tax=Novosphingobium album (ex Liu et al. 2023) TaxID=3031130 RepID=A0ABT5WLY8_9SPHN|nr:DUF2141 domain-containing protein [Novosphingobium album (ex Liu et al. 2023)]MDE8650894.1 DUF2141 domain-containing protein [Novosphingobium album (ex Liu et al. 2023)]
MNPLSTTALLPLLAATALPSTPDLGKAEGRCRPDENGPAFLVTPDGLKDRQGTLKLEVYPANDRDFLADDNVLIQQGKPFSRVETPVPPAGRPLCIRVPRPGAYAVVLLHDRDQNRKFGWRIDGIGFSRNPRLGFSKPGVNKVRVMAGGGPTPLDIVLNYRSGLGVAPLRQKESAR